jgi:hypothetical protein
MNIFMTLSAILNFFDCNPPAKTWDSTIPGTCWDDVVHLGIDIASSGYSAACDLALALIPWLVVINLQMKNKEKIGVAVAMSMGVL